MANWIAEDDPAAARRMMAEVNQAVSLLADQPEMGRAGRVPGTRELLLPRYSLLVPYRVAGSELQVLRVFHTRQIPPNVW
ncbi:type II toxin-antitoxin system RelE/ParE family toxin [Halomonas sp. GXIMD04776]|uniref:type II toxin-antitoxin system RelE/ParE family toxin n=1 Tax=Halomonas sp. GXIMD04776 TaxID=3415605 RepID=UPI003C8A298A